MVALNAQPEHNWGVFFSVDAVFPQQAFQRAKPNKVRAGTPRSVCFSLCVALVLLLSPHAALAQDGRPSATPERSNGWGDASTVMALSAAGIQLFMPRVFYADPEVTAGWKARWHVSVLGPSMTLATLALLNEASFKESFASPRPDCGEVDNGDAGCGSFGLFSTHSLLAFSALGQGSGIFLVDTLKWSDGEFSGAAFAGNVGVPLVLSLLTAIGRTAGNWESGGQVWGSAGVGFASGMAMGVLYSLLQRPECGYGGDLICW